MVAENEDYVPFTAKFSWNIETENQCCGYMTLWCGSMPLTNGSGSFYFRHWPSSCQQKTNKKKVFLFITNTFWRCIYIILKKSKRSHKTGGIKVFLPIFAWRLKDLDSDPYRYLFLIDPDPGGLKTYRSDGFGSDPQHCGKPLEIMLDQKFLFIMNLWA